MMKFIVRVIANIGVETRIRPQNLPPLWVTLEEPKPKEAENDRKKIQNYYTRKGRCRHQRTIACKKNIKRQNAIIVRKKVVRNRNTNNRKTVVCRRKGQSTQNIVRKKTVLSKKRIKRIAKEHDKALRQFVFEIEFGLHNSYNPNDTPLQPLHGQKAANILGTNNLKVEEERLQARRISPLGTEKPTKDTTDKIKRTNAMLRKDGKEHESVVHRQHFERKRPAPGKRRPEGKITVTHVKSTDSKTSPRVLNIVEAAKQRQRRKNLRQLINELGGAKQFSPQNSRASFFGDKSRDARMAAVISAIQEELIISGKYKDLDHPNAGTIASLLSL